MTGKITRKWSNIPITVKVSVAYAVCSILQKGIVFFTMPIFAGILTKEQYGMYIVYSSWVGVLSIILTLNLAYGSFSKAMVKFEKDRDGYIASVEGICTALMLLFFIIYLPLRKYWNRLFELPTVLVCVLVAEIMTTTAIQIWSGKKRFEFKYKSVVVITLCISILSPLLAYILVINMEKKGYARIFGYAIVSILIGGSIYLINLIRGKKFFKKEYWKYGFQFNIPLMAYYFSQVIFNQSDRIMIDHMVGREEAAIYGVAYTIAMVLLFVLNAINNSYVPWFYIKLKEGKPEENKTVSLIIAGLMAVLLLGIIWLAPEAILFLGGKKYTEAVYVIPPVASSLLLLFYSQLFINVEFYYERKKELVLASVGGGLLNLILNWYLIPIFGYIVAAYTTLASYIVFAGANYFAMKKILREKNIEDNAYNYKWLILILLFFTVLTVVGVVLYDVIWARIFVALITLISLFILRRKVKEYLKIALGKR